MFIYIIKALYSNSSNKVRMYDDLSLSFHFINGVKQDYPTPHFLLDVAFDYILKIALLGLDNGSVDSLPGERLFGLDYANGFYLTLQL